MSVKTPPKFRSLSRTQKIRRDRTGESPFSNEVAIQVAHEILPKNIKEKAAKII